MSRSCLTLVTLTCALFTSLVVLADPTRAADATATPTKFTGLHWRNIGPLSRWSHRCGRGRADATRNVLHGSRRRWHLEIERLHANVDADLRRSGHGIDRRARRRAVGSERHLRGQRRRLATSRSLDRLTASTNRSTRVRRGRILAYATRNKFRRSQSIRTIQTRCSLRQNGHPFGANEERGLYRSRDGGATFPKSSR